jgi:hypothetical protein
VVLGYNGTLPDGEGHDEGRGCVFCTSELNFRCPIVVLENCDFSFKIPDVPVRTPVLPSSVHSYSVWAPEGE